MQLRKKLVMPIYDNVSNKKTLLGKIAFDEPMAYDVFLFRQDKNSTKVIDRLWWIIKNNFIIQYPKFIPNNFLEKILHKYYIKKNKRRFHKYVMQTIYHNIDFISDKLIKAYLKKNISIFEWINYPKLKWQKGRNRSMTELECYIWLCNGRWDSVNKLLKTHTLTQIGLLLDAKILSSNEKIEEYQHVNDLALSRGPWWGQKKKEQEDIMRIMNKLEKDKKEGRVKYL